MTVTNTNTAVKHVGNGSATEFAFDFLIPTSAEIKVTHVDTTDSTVTVLTQGVDYSVDEFDNPNGGTVTYPLTGSPLPATEYLMVERDMAITQTLDILNQGGFLPEALEGQFDRIVLIAQQLANQLSRSLKRPVGTDGGLVLAGDAGSYAVWDANGNLVAGPSAEDIESVVAISDDIVAVAAIIAAVEAVAAIDSDVTTVATNLADVTNFSDVWLGPKASNPSTRNDASALQAGDLYFNTVSEEVRFYTGSSWTAIASVTTASAITNDSGVTGANVDDALNTLDGGKSATSHTHDGRYYTESEIDSGFVPVAREVNAGGLATGGGALSSDRTITVPIASQAEAEAGSANDVSMTPLRTAQAIADNPQGQPIPSSSTDFAVGTLLLARTSGSVNNGGTTAGSGLTLPYFSSAGSTFNDSGQVLSGTWKNVSGRNLIDNQAGYFVRTA